MLSIKPLLCIFLCIASVSCQGDPRMQKVIEYLQEGGNCEYSFLEQKYKHLTTCMPIMFSIFPVSINDNLALSDITIHACQANLTKCIAAVGDGLEKCLHEDKYRFFIENPIKAISAFCPEGGKALKDFVTNGLQCFRSEAVSKDLSICSLNMAQEFQKVPLEVMYNVNMVEMCRLTTDLGACFISALNTCEDKTAKNFIENIVNKKLEEICKNVDGKISSATTASQFKILLFISIVISILHLSGINL